MISKARSFTEVPRPQKAVLALLVDLVTPGQRTRHAEGKRARPQAKQRQKMKTVSMREQDVVRSWWIIDAQGKTLGRIATEVASRLRGKHKPEFTPHVDTGDYIVIVNAEKVRVTGNKEQGKMYWRHGASRRYSQHICGKNARGTSRAHAEIAVKGMLPKNPWDEQCLETKGIFWARPPAFSAATPGLGAINDGLRLRDRSTQDSGCTCIYLQRQGSDFG